jgi:hypothetical protein
MSLKGDKYENVEEIQFRIGGSVVLYEGRPVYISRVAMPEGAEEAKEIARVFFHELPFGGAAKRDPFGDEIQPFKPKAGEVRKFLSSKKFDLAPFPMGYWNTAKGEAVFVSRSPVRQNRQGLTQESCNFKDCRGKAAQDYSFAGMIKCQGFVDMINGKYPTFKEAGDKLDAKEGSSVAVSRNFAFIVDHDLEALLLMHRGIKCGLALKGDKALRLPPKFHFLRQEAEECRIPLA